MIRVYLFCNCFCSLFWGILCNKVLTGICMYMVYLEHIKGSCSLAWVRLPGGMFWVESLTISSVQFSSVAQSCPTLCDPMNHSTPGKVMFCFLICCIGFKSRDITLPTKVCLVKAMVFPVVMCGCESLTVKKAECWRIDAFELWCWRRLLRVPWTARRSVLGVHWKDWCWSWSSNTLATSCDKLTHWKRP